MFTLGVSGSNLNPCPKLCHGRCLRCKHMKHLFMLAEDRDHCLLRAEHILNLTVTSFIAMSSSTAQPKQVQNRVLDPKSSSHSNLSRCTDICCLLPMPRADIAPEPPFHNKPPTTRVNFPLCSFYFLHLPIQLPSSFCPSVAYLHHSSHGVVGLLFLLSSRGVFSLSPM